MLKIFYINLDASQDRNQNMIEQLDALGLSYERIPAVYGKQLSAEQKSFVDSKRFLLRTKRHIQNGEIGCAASHRLIWQKMCDNDIAHALILEDDVVIDKRLLDIIDQPTNYQDFDLINLSSALPYYPDLSQIRALLGSGHKVMRDSRNTREFAKLDWGKHWKIYALHTLAEDCVACECDPTPALTSAYLLSLKGARQLLRASERLDMPIDNVWRYASGELRQAFLAKPLIVQTDNDTSIGDRSQTVTLSVPQKLQRAMLKRQPNPRVADVKRMYHVK